MNVLIALPLHTVVQEHRLKLIKIKSTGIRINCESSGVCCWKIWKCFHCKARGMCVIDYAPCNWCFLPFHHTCFGRNLRLSGIFYTLNSCSDIHINISFCAMVKQLVGCIPMTEWLYVWYTKLVWLQYARAIQWVNLTCMRDDGTAKLKVYSRIRQ